MVELILSHRETAEAQTLHQYQQISMRDMEELTGAHKAFTEKCS